MEKYSEDIHSLKYIMSVKYNSSNKILTISLIDYNSKQISSLNYKLKTNFFEIKYIPPKVRNIGNH